MGELDVLKVPLIYIERVVNEVLPGLQMHVRDLDTTGELSAKYVLETIICEKAFTDVPCKAGGLP